MNEKRRARNYGLVRRVERETGKTRHKLVLPPTTRHVDTTAARLGSTFKVITTFSFLSLPSSFPSFHGLSLSRVMDASCTAGFHAAAGLVFGTDTDASSVCT